MKQSQGCTKNEDKTWKDQYGRSMRGYATDVTFRNTHSIFADIIQAEIFEPNLSNAIPNTSHIFACSAPFR